MTRNGNANALMLLIILVVITFVFGFLAWTQYDTRMVILEGRPDTPLKITQDNSLTRLRQQITRLEDEVTQAKIDRFNRRLKLANLAGSLARAGYYWHNNAWVGADTENGEDTSWTHTRKIIAADLEELQTWQTGYEDPARHEFRALEDAISQARDVIENIGDQIADEEDTFNNTRDRLINEQDNLNEKREVLRKEGRMRFAELSIKKSKLESRIRDLLELKLQWVEELHPDGEILSVANGGQHVIVDLGTEDNIKAGMRFEIFALVHGNHVSKGLCEVVEPAAGISTCRVLSTVNDRKQPIATGDKIGNPVFDTSRPQSFVLAGEFQNFNAEDLANFIRRSGGIVRDKLDPNVDFLVAGMRSDTEQDAAREYRVLAMKEDLLVRFLDTTFRPK